MERHTTFAIPLAAGDFHAVQAARAHDLDALRAEAHRVLHRPLHRAAKHDPLLELLRDRIRNQLGVDLRLADFLDVQADIAAHHLAQVTAQRLDVLAFFADDDAGTRAVNRDARVLGGSLDRHLRNRRMREFLFQILAHLDVFGERRRVVLAVGEPLRRPIPRDAEAEPDRMNLLSHGGPYWSLPSPTTTRMWQVCLPITLPRPLARAVKRLSVVALST